MPETATVNPRKIRVSIVNPTPNGNRYTSLHNAQRFVCRGVARWCGDRLEFIDGDAISQATIAEEIRRLRPAYLAYDRVMRPMTLQELRAIPFTFAEKALVDRSHGRSRHARN